MGSRSQYTFVLGLLLLDAAILNLLFVVRTVVPTKQGTTYARGRPMCAAITTFTHTLLLLLLLLLL